MMLNIELFKELAKLIEIKEETEECLKVLFEIQNGTPYSVKVPFCRKGSCSRDEALFGKENAADVGNIIQLMVGYYQGKIKECNDVLNQYSIGTLSGTVHVSGVILDKQSNDGKIQSIGTYHGQPNDNFGTIAAQCTNPMDSSLYYNPYIHNHEGICGVAKEEGTTSVNPGK